jgi:hypothetical protein
MSKRLPIVDHYDNSLNYTHPQDLVKTLYSLPCTLLDVRYSPLVRKPLKPLHGFP